MFFRKRIGNRSVEDVFLPGDDTLYRPVIKRLQDREMYRARDFEDDYVQLIRVVSQFERAPNTSSNNEEAS